MKKILIVIGILVIAVFGVLVVEVGATEDFNPGEYQGSVYQNSTNLDNYQTYLNSLTNPIYPTEEVVIDATKNYTVVDEDFGDSPYIQKCDEIDGLHIPETVTITYKFNVATAGYYNIKIKYYTIEGRSSSISKGIMINGKYPFTEAKNFILTRSWIDSFDVAEKRVEGEHDYKPSQIEKNIWKEEKIKDTQGYYEAPYYFYFNEGENEITFVPDKEPVVFSSITLYQESAVSSYSEVYQSYLNNGYQKQSENNIAYKVQGESTYEKSSPSLTPVANYTSYNVEPYERFITRYNTIGGTNWRISGDWISWKLEVPESGLYQITLKTLQNFSRGQLSSRILYINGEVPFSECYNVQFNYDSDWQNTTIGDENGAYWFYLNEGENILTLESTVGSYGESVRLVNEVISDLNWIYRKVIMRTGVNPSQYHDFRLKESIPELYDKIESCIKKLDLCINSVVEIAGERSDLIGSLDRAKYQLETFLDDEKKIQIGLGELETNITALGTWVTTVSAQPLTVDYIVVHGENTSLPKAGTNFFQKIWHELVMLVGSFFSDTSLKSSLDVDGPTIEVWIMTGRDQSNLLRQLIDESFTVQNNVNVELKLVTSTVLLPATLSGNGPDVAIGVAQNIPVNWGIRNSVVDLTQFSDFENFSKNFYDSAITPFRFDGSVYALPDTQDFLVQFVRSDIFQEMGLVDESGKVIVPTNWDEVIDLLPILQKQYLDYYLPNVTGALSPLFYSMIKQYGGNLYLNNGAESGLLTTETSEAFYDFVNFYRNYGFAIEANFTNRFRTGEMPIGVASYTLYNTLSVSAPEIRGNWEFALLPGYKDTDTTTYASTGTATGTIILQQTEELEASWKFLKWWLGAEAQENYARGMEAILGAAARYPTANVEAFANLPWSAKDYRILEEQRKVAVGVPTIPGDYIVGRYIDYAFRQVINNDINPNDSLYTYHQKINIELARKREEFNLD